MQVTHVQEHVTHAVIGGKKTIDFGISDSPEFFNILSSTLYKDQILAVAREVLCNAWDAHIEAGRTDKAVEVTMSNNSLVIKDFGKGIHRDDIGTIYCVYGNSTKKNDGKQTGGFGLGCKAPFAYTEHFEVTSSHAGVKTIYRISKSSAQASGKPGATEITSMPTDETGIQVSIRLKSDQDGERFKSLIKRIARNGDMNVHFNGEPIETLGFDVSAGNFLITCKNDILESPSPIMVRYGNVIYPVDLNKELLGYRTITDHLDRLSTYSTKYRIIFQAPPDSISVTPSRESLSMQEHTMKTLNDLFGEFTGFLNKEFRAECSKQATEAIKEAIVDNKHGVLLTFPMSLPFKDEDTTKPLLRDLSDMAKRYLHRNYLHTLELFKENLKQRLELLSQAKLVDKGKAHTYIRALKSVTRHPNSAWEYSSWLQKQIIGPLLAKLQINGLHSDRLFVIDPNNRNTEYRNPIVSASKAAPRHLFDAFPYLRNIIVVSSSYSNVLTRAEGHPIIKENVSANNVLFYHCGTKQEDKEKALKFFKSTGMTVVDLTFRQDYEPEPLKKVKSTKGATVKRKGYVALSGLKTKWTYIELGYYRESDVATVDEPECVTQINLRGGNNRCIARFTGTVSYQVAKLFGDKCAVVTTSKAYDSLIAKGAKPVEDYVIEKLLSYINNSSTFKDLYAFNAYSIIDQLTDSSCDNLIHTIFDNDALMKQFGLDITATEEDKNYYSLWNSLSDSYPYNQKPEVQALKKTLDLIPLDKKCLALIKKINRSNSIQYVDLKCISVAIEDGDVNTDEFKRAMAILNYAFNH